MRSKHPAQTRPATAVSVHVEGALCANSRLPTAKGEEGGPCGTPEASLSSPSERGFGSECGLEETVRLIELHDWAQHPSSSPGSGEGCVGHGNTDRVPLERPLPPTPGAWHMRREQSKPSCEEGSVGARRARPYVQAKPPHRPPGPRGRGGMREGTTLPPPREGRSGCCRYDVQSSECSEGPEPHALCEIQRTGLSRIQRVQQSWVKPNSVKSLSPCSWKSHLQS